MDAYQNALLGSEGGINKQLSQCACLRWPPGSLKCMDMGALQQCKDGLNPDMFLLHPLRHKMPETVLSASKGDKDYRQVYGRCPAGRPWS